MEIYSIYNRPKLPGLKCPEHSLTEQVYKEQCDLNFLIRKYHLEDDPFQLKMYVDPTTREMRFMDTTQVPDIYAALREHQRVSRIFSELDYNVQAQFNFSVDAFAEFCLTAPVEEVNKLKVPNLEFKDFPTPIEPETSAPASDGAPTQESSPKA